MSEEEPMYKRYDKRFLDTTSKFGSDEYASVCWSVNLDTSYQDKREKFQYANMSGTLRIADCNKHVSIELYCERAVEVEERLKKLEEIRTSIDGLIAAIKGARELMLVVEQKPNPKYVGDTPSED